LVSSFFFPAILGAAREDKALARGLSLDALPFLVIFIAQKDALARDDRCSRGSGTISRCMTSSTAREIFTMNPQQLGFTALRCLFEHSFAVHRLSTV
jgi:hypothetical protein